MYNNPYMLNQNYNQQSMNERIDNQIAQLQQMKEQMKHQQPTSINQTFQLAPQTNNGLKIVNSIDEVQKELTIVDTPFVDSNYSTLWIKNSKGEIRSFELKEIKPKDEKDILIENLQLQINELKGRILDEQQLIKTSNEHEGKQLDEPVKTKTASNVSNSRTSNTKSK